jgi:dimethylhistidine N-methyltransferase
MRQTPQSIVNGGAPIEVLDLESPVAQIRAEVLAGLSEPRKTLPCKLFYDERGSHLFEDICRLPEYYPTRVELQIMLEHGDEMAEAVGPQPLIVEYGSGSSLKTRVLLDHLPDAAGYLPIDISLAHLTRAARALSFSYPHLPIRPVCADYTGPFRLPSLPGKHPPRVIAYFPGSTIGNFEPPQALKFLESVRTTCGRKSGLLIGVDLVKDPATLHAAYNDAAGVTAAFNLNLLRRINRDIGSDFKLEAFAHYAYYNPALARVEMHLVSRQQQTVDLADGLTARFYEGESIHTESSHKYTLESFHALAEKAGYRRIAVWVDPRHWFSVQYFIEAK